PLDHEQGGHGGILSSARRHHRNGWNPDRLPARLNNEGNNVNPSRGPSRDGSAVEQGANTRLTYIDIRTEVGPDCVLSFSKSVGMSEANQEVRVVVESVASGPKKAPEMTQEEWHRFIAETAGSISDPTFERPEQGDFEDRDPWQ